MTTLAYDAIDHEAIPPADRPPPPTAFEGDRMGGAPRAATALDCARRMGKSEEMTQEGFGMSEGGWRGFDELLKIRLPKADRSVRGEPYSVVFSPFSETDDSSGRTGRKVMKKRKIWCIEGFDSTNKIFEMHVPLHHVSQRQMNEVLQRLVCRHLSEREIVSASLNRNAERNMLLDINRRETSSKTISCGDNPHYLAKVVEE